MRIAISGSYSTGKTTTSLALSLATGVEIIHARTMREILPVTFPGKKLEMCAPHEITELIFYRLAERIMAETNNPKSFVSDGSSIQELAYCMFNPNFLLGNIIDEDLQTIWKKNRLKHLEEKATYHNSRCGKCKSFSDCKGTESRGVCWKEIIHAYGEDKWNYPDPKCPHAPSDIRHFYV